VNSAWVGLYNKQYGFAVKRKFRENWHEPNKRCVLGKLQDLILSKRNKKMFTFRWSHIINITVQYKVSILRKVGKRVRNLF
jgi:hypothetical protein